MIAAIEISVPTDHMLLILDGLEMLQDRAARHGDLNRADYCHDLYERITAKLNPFKAAHLIRADLEQAVTICKGLTELALLMVAFDDQMVDLLRGLAATQLAHKFADEIATVIGAREGEPA